MIPVGVSPNHRYWTSYTIANLLNLDLEVREYDGDPVQLVIAQNLHRRHLNGLQRVSCVGACIDWAKQGQQRSMHAERDDSGKFSPIPAYYAGIGEGADSEADPEFFTQSERAALGDSNLRTVQQSDSYEKAGLGPEVRSGAISGAEAERRVRDPDAPKPAQSPGPRRSQAAVPTPATGNEAGSEDPGVPD